MLLSLALIGALGCGLEPITVQEAKTLVLASPNIRASVRERHAHPFFDYIGPGPDGWNFDVNSRTPCAGPGPCSTLLGHYSVSRSTGAVEDLDAAGGEGRVISTPRLRGLQQAFRARRCASHLHAEKVMAQCRRADDMEQCVKARGFVMQWSTGECSILNDRTSPICLRPR
jgi:hypothetical protein